VFAAMPSGTEKNPCISYNYIGPARSIRNLVDDAMTLGDYRLLASAAHFLLVGFTAAKSHG
jgi:hypothetical protein